MSRFLTILLFGISLLIFQQSTKADGDLLLKGRVMDAYSKSPLTDAHVIIGELQLGTVTDSKGLFTFPELPSGTYTLSISHIGYLDYNTQIDLHTETAELSFMVRPVVVEIDPVTITATLTRRKLSLMPARVGLISKQLVEQIPALNTDDLLRGIANVYVHRPWGIFSKSASVTMRGLPGSSRTLILLDGVPMNKAAGGSVNWNFIEPNQIDNIEIVKGPSSAIYGNNAMAGVINITTKKPIKPIEGNVSAFGGSLGTYGGALDLGGAGRHKESGFYWKMNGFLRKGDGYILEPEETRDTYGLQS